MSAAQQTEKHYVYIVCCANGSLYTGYTTNIEQRLAAHNAGKGGRYTRAHRPVTLLTYWVFRTKREAMQVEYQIKQLPRQKKLEITQGLIILEWMTNTLELREESDRYVTECQIRSSSL